jgi:hypothetical protein
MWILKYYEEQSKEEAKITDSGIVTLVNPHEKRFVPEFPHMEPFKIILNEEKFRVRLTPPYYDPKEHEIFFEEAYQCNVPYWFLYTEVILRKGEIIFENFSLDFTKDSYKILCINRTPQYETDDRNFYICFERYSLQLIAKLSQFRFLFADVRDYLKDIFAPPMRLSFSHALARIRKVK